MSPSPALVRFSDPSPSVECLPDGSIYLRSKEGLAERPKNVTTWLRRWAAERPAQAVLAERDAAGRWEKVSYSDALIAVRSLGTALLWAGCGNDRPLMILSENSVEAALLTWAANYAGIPVAPVSPAYSLAPPPLNRLRAIAELVKPGLVFAQDATRYAAGLATVGIPESQQMVVTGASIGMVRFKDWVRTAVDDNIDAVHAGIDPQTPAKYMFTSGSTGAPKAVVITHEMLVAAQEMTAQIIVERPKGPMLQVDWLPWHHVMGGNVVLGRTLRFGGTLYIDEGRPLPDRFSQTLANLRDVAPSYYFNVPAGYAMLADEMERDPAFAAHFFSKLEFAYFAGAALPQDLQDRLQRISERVSGRPLVIGTAYGSTETTAAVMMRTWHDANSACIGLPLPACALKLLPDPNLPGRFELRVKGPHVFHRYLGRPEVSPERDEEGFYRVGDAVRLAEPGNPAAGLMFAGRFSDDFKLANGTWVRTAGLRQKLLGALAPVLREAVIFGEGRECVAALAWIDPKACRELLGADAGTEEQELAKNPLLHAWIAQKLSAVNAGVKASSLRIEHVGIETRPLSAEAYELTDKGSINARAVADRRATAIAALYARKDVAAAA